MFCPTFAFMKKSKKVFLALAAVFILGLGYLGYDIGRRTTFPGAKPPLQGKTTAPDSVSIDSVKATQR